MTTTINLLPWREERRKQRQQEFVMMLVLAAIVGGGHFLDVERVCGSANYRSARPQ